MEPDPNLSFPPFRLDTVTNRLWRGEQVVLLRPKPLAVLRYLIEQQGRVVASIELLQALWPNTVVSGGVLKVAIQAIRHALSDDAATPQFIETVPGRGYRWIGAVQSPDQSGVRSQNQSAQLQELNQAGLQTPDSGLRDSLLVGREAELRRLHGWLGKTLSGTRQVVFVTGEPGIGKTSVVDAFVAQLSGAVVHMRMPLWVARGQCVEQYGAGEAYLPILEAVERLCREPGHERLLPLLRQYAPLWLAQMPSFLSPTERERLQREVLGSTQERMLRELVAVIETLTADTVLVLVLEDLHWSDYSTLDLLGRLARRREAARLLILGTYRPVAMLTHEHPLRGVLQDLQARRLCGELSLTGLTEAAVEEYLNERFPQHALPTRLARVLYQRTEGNPLFLVNLVDDLVAQGLLVPGEEGWALQDSLDIVVRQVPESSRQLIAQQSERLSPEEQQVLRAASVAGAEFSAAAVAAAVEVERVEVEEHCEGLARQQQFLRRAGISEWPDGTVAARYGFLHALYQQLWHEQVSIGRRQQWHQRIGVRMEAAYGNQAGEIAAELAIHFEEGHDYCRAVHYLQQAAENTLQRSAHQETIAYLTKALGFLRTLPEEPDRPQRELSLLSALGVPLLVTKGYANLEVGEVFTQARQLCQKVEKDSHLFQVLWGINAFAAVRGECWAAWETAGDMLRLAQSLQDPATLMMANLARGGTALWMGEFTAAREHLEQSIALYDTLQRRDLPVHLGYDSGIACFSYSALALWGLGYPDQALQRVQEALKLAQKSHQPYTLVHTQAWAASLYQHRREEHAAHEQAEATMTFSANGGFPLWLAMGTVLRGWALVQQGEVEQGIAQIRQGMDAYQETGAGWGQSYYPALLAEAYGKARQPKEGLKVLAETLPPQKHLEERWWETEKYRLKGELIFQTGGRKPEVKVQEEAESCFHQALTLAQSQCAKMLELRAVMSLSRLWQRQGKKKQAHEMLAEVYDWFTEGFDTKDLQEAKVLLARFS